MYTRSKRCDSRVKRSGQEAVTMFPKEKRKKQRRGRSRRREKAAAGTIPGLIPERKLLDVGAPAHPEQQLAVVRRVQHWCEFAAARALDAKCSAVIGQIC